MPLEEQGGETSRVNRTVPVLSSSRKQSGEFANSMPAAARLRLAPLTYQAPGIVSAPEWQRVKGAVDKAGRRSYEGRDPGN